MNTQITVNVTLDALRAPRAARARARAGARAAHVLGLGGTFLDSNGIHLEGDVAFDFVGLKRL